jgi:hypothetical protein
MIPDQSSHMNDPVNKVSFARQLDLFDFSHHEIMPTSGLWEMDAYYQNVLPPPSNKSQKNHSSFFLQGEIDGSSPDPHSAIGHLSSNRGYQPVIPDHHHHHNMSGYANIGDEDHDICPSFI